MAFPPLLSIRRVSEPVEIRLIGDIGVGLRVVALFGPHVQYKTDGQEVEIGNQISVSCSQNTAVERKETLRKKLN